MELEEAWQNSSGLFSKILVGIGFAVTAVAAGLFSLFSALFGEDEKTKLYKQVADRYRTFETEKQNALRNEWAGLSKGIQQQYRQNIEEKVKAVEEQLNKAIANTTLDQIEVQKRLEQLQRWEEGLQSLRSQFQQEYNNLSIPSKTEVAYAGTR